MANFWFVRKIRFRGEQNEIGINNEWLLVFGLPLNYMTSASDFRSPNFMEMVSNRCQTIVIT